jgi:hypothetical protein
MKVLVSGSAGRIAYIDGDKIAYAAVSDHEIEWRNAPLGDVRRLFLYADDVYEIEVESLDEAVSIGRLQYDVQYSLTFLDILMSNARDGGPYVEFVEFAELFTDRYSKPSVKDEVDKIVNLAPLPKGITCLQLRQMADCLPTMEIFLRDLADSKETAVA